MKKYIAESFGTCVLVFFGCGSLAIIGNVDNGLSAALAFGISIVVVYSFISKISGCHINPLISFYELVEKNISKKEFFKYIAAQIVGAIVGALLIVLIISQCGNLSISSLERSANNFGLYEVQGLTMAGGFILEILLTFIFMLTYMKFSKNASLAPYLGIIVGLAFMFVNVISLTVIGGSANPAKSLAAAFVFGPFSGQTGLIFQVWIFVLGSIIGTLGSIWIYKVFIDKPNNKKTKSVKNKPKID